MALSLKVVKEVDVNLTTKGNWKYFTLKHTPLTYVKMAIQTGTQGMQTGIALKNCLLWRNVAPEEKNLHWWNKQPGFLREPPTLPWPRSRKKLMQPQATICPSWGSSKMPWDSLICKQVSLCLTCFPPSFSHNLWCYLPYSLKKHGPMTFFFGLICPHWKAFTPIHPSLSSLPSEVDI